MRLGTRVDFVVNPNPIRDREQQNPCRVASPADPGDNGGDKWAVVAPSPWPARDPRNSLATVPVALRWGTLEWGYRHIAYGRPTLDSGGHGWNAEVATHVAAALRATFPFSTALDPNPRPGKNHVGWHDNWEYYYHYIQGSMQCTRIVVVQFGQGPKDATPKHIITTFAYPGWSKLP